VFFWVPIRRRKWPLLMGLVILAGMAMTAIGCGSSSAMSPPPNSGNSGTTAGNYTVTVTGTSGTVQATAAIAITVK